MIYCVWYPSGGFGHFVNAVLTLHGKNFIRPNNNLHFSNKGNSHSLDLVVPKYLHDCWPGGIEFLDNKNYSVLVDNGINNESESFKSTFPNATVIKICYTDISWPVVARTMINKAMGSSIQDQLPVTEWATTEPWALREKYFLFLRDHTLRYAWRKPEQYTIYVSDIYTSYDKFYRLINSVVETDPFEELWLEWRQANSQYIDPVETAKQIISYVLDDQSTPMAHITDVWTQAVIYYYIWLTFEIEVPHNDFAGFFSNTDQIRKLVV